MENDALKDLQLSSIMKLSAVANRQVIPFKVLEH